MHPSGMGKSLDTYARLVPADYCNRRDSTRCNSRTRRALPNQRTVSLQLQSFIRNVPFNPERTRLLADFGQFITHDMIQDRHY